MYFGRQENGIEVRLHVQCKTSAGVIVEPDAPPFVDVWNNGVKFFSAGMFPEERTNAVGLFVFPLYLMSFTVGTCQCVFRWITGGVSHVIVGYFEIVAGGNDDGAVISMFYFNTPQGKFIVHQTDAGILKMGKNPQ